MKKISLNQSSDVAPSNVAALMYGLDEKNKGVPILLLDYPFDGKFGYNSVRFYFRQLSRLEEPIKKII